MNAWRAIFLFLLSFFLIQSGWANGGPCDSILKDGTMSRADYSSNQNLKRLLHWRYASQDVNSSIDDRSFGASIPIKKVLVGVDFDESQQSEVRRAISSSLDADLVEKYAVSYMLTSGDSVIAEAWSKCMQNNDGFFVWFGARNGGVSTVNVEFHLKTDRNRIFKVTDAQWSLIGFDGGRREMVPIKNDCFKPGRSYGTGDTCSFVVDGVDASTGILLVVNGKYTNWWALWGGVTDSTTAFLPPNVKWVHVTDRVVTTSLKPPVIASASRNYWQDDPLELERVCVERKDVGGDAVTFIKATAKSWAFEDCNGSTGYCRGSDVKVTDEDFCWGGRMKTDRDASSCTCRVAAEIEVIKSRWQPVSLSPAAASK